MIDNRHWYEIENGVDDDVLFDLFDLIGQGSNVVLSNLAFHMAGNADGDSKEDEEHRDKLAASISALSLGVAFYGRRICGEERFDAQAEQTVKEIKEDFEKQARANKAAKQLAELLGIDIDSLLDS